MPSIHKRKYHGLRKHPLYGTWVDMKKRCNAPNNASYEYYGGRGIKVCDRWIHSFPTFLKDMGERPEGMSLDRINTDGDYEPSNCRWATSTEQIRNRRNLTVNQAGFVGVKQSGKSWTSRITVGYKSTHLGTFSSPEEAYEAYAIKREALGF